MFKRWMLILPMLLSGLVATVQAGDFDWSACKATLDAKQGAVFLKQDRKFIAMVNIKPIEAVSELQYATPDGQLELDTRALMAKYPQASVTFRYMPLGYETSMSMHNTFIEMDTLSQPSGLTGKLYFEGSTGPEKKHYWKAKGFVLTDVMQSIRMEQALPENLNDLHLRFDLTSPGIYRFGDVRFGKVQDTTSNPVQNHITNGNAEQGWYNTGLLNGKVLAMADDGKAYSGYGKTYDKFINVALDSKEKHTGQQSFRIDCAPDADGTFVFNSVPFIPNAPALFSIWLKAEKPNTAVNMSLFLSSGLAYGMTVHADTQWQRYEMHIPHWGEKVQGIARVGDVTDGYGAVYKMTTPRINTHGGTIWMDDAIYQLADTLTEPTQQPAAIAINGKLNNPKGYYFSGQPIRATFDLTSHDARSVPVTWELLDFQGRRVAGQDAGQVKLTANSPTSCSYDLPASDQLRGPLNWRFTIDGIEHQFYLGIIDKPAPQLARLGINYDSRQNAQTAIDMLKDFRFGSVRMWSHFREMINHGFRDVPAFYHSGFYVMMCVSDCRNDAPGFLVPVDFTDWQKHLAAQASAVRGMVNCYEILNESNIWSGRKPNPDPDKYQEMTQQANARTIEAAAKALHSVDPDVQIAGPTSCHTDVSWTAGVLADGAEPYLDIITEHPYRQSPEFPDYADDIQQLREVASRYRKDYPLVASEAGERSVALTANNAIIEPMRYQASYDVRNMLIALGCGMQQYYHFSMDQTAMGTGWAMTQMGNIDTDGMAQPAPVMYALRNLADRIGEGKPAGRVKLGNDRRCYLFDRGDQRVAAIWKWNGKPETMTLPNAQLTAYDFMGNVLPTDHIELGLYPVYVQSALTADALSKLIASHVNISGDAPMSASLVITGPQSFGIKLQNDAGRPQTGRIEILTPGIVTSAAQVAFDAIEPESATVIDFKTSQTIGPVQRPIKVRVIADGSSPRTWDFDLRSMLVPHTDHALTVDGDLSDWPADAAAMPMVGVVKLNGWQTAQDQLASNVRLAWDENYLYLAVVSNKADNVQNPISTSALWKGDGIQIAFDPLHNALPGTLGYQDDDFEFAAGRFKDQPVVYMYHASAVRYDSVDKPLGLVPNVQCAIRTQGGQTVYELAFPRLLVSPFRLQANATMRFDVIQNINNGKARVGWLELTPGIGQMPKQPGQFMDMVLIH